MQQTGRKRELKVSFQDAEYERDRVVGGTKRVKMDGMSIENNEIIATFHSLDPSKYSDLFVPMKDIVRIGRSKSKKNDILLNNHDCSSVHCELFIGRQFSNFDLNLLTVRDLSSNGTFINDVCIGRNNSSLLRDGDRLSFSSQLHYIVRYNMKFKSEKKSFFDKYIMTDTILGTGHYAQVKEAVNRKTGVVFAVKIFNPTTKEDQATQLNRELEILVNLNHPNIIGFYDTYLEPVSANTLTTLLVLEKINGGELFNRIVKKGKLSQLETKEICKQLLNGLKYLHSMNIVHRDLKPENILLSIDYKTDDSIVSNGPWDVNEMSVTVKIADFGLAKFIGNRKFTTTLCGTPAYVAPEVLVNTEDRKYNKSVDMWSVGVLLYVCLCGFPPFSEELGPPSMRQQILQGKFAFYSPYWDEIDDVYLDLITRLLVVKPDDRLTVERAINHECLKDVENIPKDNMLVDDLHLSNDIYNDMVSLRARQLSIRIPSTSRGYSCEPITLQNRANTGLTDDIIVQRYCHHKENSNHDTEMT